MGLARKKLLHQEMVYDHAEETTRGHGWIDRAESAFGDPQPDIAGQQIVVPGKIGAEVAMRKPVILQPAEHEQPEEAVIRGISRQDIVCDRGENLAVVVAAGSQPRFELLPARGKPAVMIRMAQ